jgi:hypothetical protein
VPDYGLRKDVGGKPYAQRSGKYATKNTGCCCNPSNCPVLWECVPCYAGQTGDPVCGCVSAYPKISVWLCQEAKCDCTGSLIVPGAVIRASYRDVPGVDWCFTVTANSRALVDLPDEVTVLGLTPDCVKCVAQGCADDSCKKPKGRFIRPRRCNFQDPKLCAWICATEVHDCEVKEILIGDQANQETGCCSFIGGPQDEQWFSSCPDTYDVWSGPGVKSCCACEGGCGGVYDFDQEVCSPGCKCLIPTFPGGHLQCCCGNIIQASASFSVRLDFTSPGYSAWQTETGTCNFANGTGSCHFYFNDSNGNASDYVQSWFPSCTGFNQIIVGEGPGVGPGRLEVCPVPNQTTSLSGSKTWNCDGGATNFTKTTTYTGNVPKRTERQSVTYHITRSNAPKCRASCSDGYINHLPGKRTITATGVGGSGGFL